MYCFLSPKFLCIQIHNVKGRCKDKDYHGSSFWFFGKDQKAERNRREGKRKEEKRRRRERDEGDDTTYHHVLAILQLVTYSSCTDQDWFSCATTAADPWRNHRKTSQIRFLVRFLILHVEVSTFGVSDFYNVCFVAGSELRVWRNKRRSIEWRSLEFSSDFVVIILFLFCYTTILRRDLGWRVMLWKDLRRKRMSFFSYFAWRVMSLRLKQINRDHQSLQSQKSTQLRY